MSKVYREMDGQDCYIVRTHHKHTVGGQRVAGQLLRHEFNGASDYCMHCTTEAQEESPRWCPALNTLAYGIDRADEEAREERFYNRCAEDLKDTVLAFGCDKETKGGPVCSIWCSREECAVTFKHDSADTPIPAGEAEYLSWRPSGVGALDRAEWKPLATAQAPSLGEPLPTLPRSDSQEANNAIGAVLLERNFPSNTQAAGRAGWEAANRWLTSGVTGTFNDQQEPRNG